jgi:2-isopropylmalate synthase
MVQPNKAIVGANAFAHESGIHQDGVLKSRETYEIMRAQDVGWSDNKIVLGKHSGRNALKSRFVERGIEIETESELNEVFWRVKDLADLKHEVFDEDLRIIANDTSLAPEKVRYVLVSSHVCSETGETPVATVTLSVEGKEVKAEAAGDGTVDAVYSAIKSITGSDAKLELYSVNAVTKGTDSQGEVTVRLEKDGKLIYGNGAHTDIIVASAKAYIDALNKIATQVEREHPQLSGV